MLKEFQTFGRELFLSGLNNSHSGNLSVRCGDRIVITRRGAMLGQLQEQDIIETGLDKDDDKTVLASRELIVHRAIYRETGALAIVHAHPVHAIALSLLTEEIFPLDAEGTYLLPKTPVLSVENAIGSQELTEQLPGLLKEYKIAMVRGHGSFAAAQSLEEAYQYTSSLENVCRIIAIYRGLEY